MRFGTRMKLAINLLRGDKATQTELDRLARVQEIHDMDIVDRIEATRQRLDEAVSRAWVTAHQDNIARREGNRYDASHPQPSG